MDNNKVTADSASSSWSKSIWSNDWEIGTGLDNIPTTTIIDNGTVWENTNWADNLIKSSWSTTIPTTYMVDSTTLTSTYDGAKEALKIIEDKAFLKLVEKPSKDCSGGWIVIKSGRNAPDIKPVTTWLDLEFETDPDAWLAKFRIKVLFMNDDIIYIFASPNFKNYVGDEEDVVEAVNKIKTIFNSKNIL